MRTSLTLLVAVAFSLTGLAAPQTINVTPSNLTGWTVTGIAPTALAAPSQLELPASTQLSRQFNSPGLVLRAAIQPTLGVDSTDWPVIEIGSTALLFARDDTQGKLLLVVGDKAPVELPVEFPLDAEGRAVDPITVNFAAADSTVTIGLLGKTLSYPITAYSSSNLELVISAGDNEPWRFDNLEVTFDAPTSGDVSGVSGNSGTTSDPSANLNADTTDAATHASTVLASNAVVTAIIPVRPTPEVAIDSSATLEIYSQAAIRVGRVEAVRAAALQSQKK